MGGIFACVSFVTCIAQSLERSRDSNVVAKTKWQNGMALGAVRCHLVSDRKSASFVWITFTESKKKLFLNFE